MGKYTYLLIDVLTILFPFILSFDKKVAFYKDFKNAFLSIICIAIPFIIWDIYFTENRIWGFNEDYLSGKYLSNLPIEEKKVRTAWLAYPVLIKKNKFF